MSSGRTDEERPGPRRSGSDPGDDADRADREVSGPGAAGRFVWVRLVVFVAIVAAAAAVAGVVGLPDPAQLRADIAAAGPAAPALFVLVYAAATLAPLSKNVLAAAAGLVFGFAVGVVVVLLAALLGALAAFALDRVLGSEAVERLTGTRVARVDALLRRRGLLAVLAVRLVPVLPFTAINYAAGLTGVRTRDYIIGTALGMIPGTIAFVALGAYGTSPGSWPFIIAVLVLVALTAAGAALARCRRRK
ncbi:TVP38/TMEM64 family protein [Pseudonocardia nigra]|uniref:TVP38/TMEM64 family protein n=1 Tax=Pseudonocardia nigra TaxID=1921578 RepID=UPI001C5E64BF|nr:VTT domain-containing protein [Pseudonocardia nigra]